MEPAAWKLLAYIAIGVIIIFVPLILLGEHRQMKFARLIQSLGGKSLGVYAGEMKNNGQNYALQYHYGSGSKKAFFTISVARPSPTALIVRKETAGDQFFKDIGLNQEIQLQYPDFDDSVYFEGENIEFTRSLFNQPGSRQAAKRILEFFTAIEFGTDGCTARRSPCSGVSFLTASVLTEVLRNIATLTAAIPTTASSSPIQNGTSEVGPHGDKNVHTADSLGGRVAGRPQSKARFRTEFTISGVVFCVGLILFLAAKKFFTPVDPWDVFFPAPLVAGLILCLGVTSVVLRMVKGHPDSSKRLFGCLVFIISGSLMASLGTVEIMNAFLDTSEAVPHKCVVLDKRVTTSKKSGDSYSVSVGAWQAQEATYDFSVGQAEYDAVVPGKTKYMITTKHGSFGYEWITSTVQTE